MPDERMPEPWLSFFAAIDAQAEEEIHLYCLGGFVVTLVYDLPRATADVDIITITPANTRAPLLELAGKNSELHQKYGVYLDLVAIVTVPDDYEERVTEIFAQTFKHLRLYALDPYDIALSKLERNIQRDRDDVKYLARKIPLDLNLLKDRYEKELRVYLGNPEREDNTLRLWIEAIEEERGSSSVPKPEKN